MSKKNNSVEIESMEAQSAEETLRNETHELMEQVMNSEISLESIEEFLALIKSPGDEEMPELEQIIDMFEQTVNFFRTRSAKGDGRKELVLQVLRTGPHTLQEIADDMTKIIRETDPDAKEISSRNVSTVMTYLKKSGIKFHTDDKGRKYIVD